MPRAKRRCVQLPRFLKASTNGKLGLLSSTPGRNVDAYSRLSNLLIYLLLRALIWIRKAHWAVL